GTSVKHFAANSQEFRRMSCSSNIDARTLREIYLAPFEQTVKEGKPDTVMCSYNKVNGVFASENKWLLTDVLRKDWGFKGYVMSDWGAVNERVPALKAGLDLEMPASGGDTDRQIVDAVKSGKLLVQPHIEGQNIKFYGVRNTDFFHVRESISTAVLQQLCTAADTLAAALSLDIYGGDAILTAANHLTIIDFNDFPSFSSCRKEAAEAIFCAVRQIKNH
ncbi:MAG: glycoside hydrolase family 3 protein, partial [Prevotella sp.]|nr:glycoside hydrolase family 3 protein [Prevotella sp.]